MDGAMRDLNLIREHADEQDAVVQRWALYGLAGGVTGLLVLALCFQLGPTTSVQSSDEADPLARLDAIGRAQRSTSGAESGPEIDDSFSAPSVDRVALSFPEQLTEDPPEMAAALAAAAAEAAHPDALPPDAFEPMPTATSTLAALPEMLPAAVAATDGTVIARVAAHDELVQSAFPAPRVTDPAREGHDGEYTLQVISYDSAEGAQAFASGLRARGHRAFVMQASVEGRGTMFRVRIGPFESMAEASAYRSRFESTEHMNTIVIRRRDTE
jgi:cell division septation protein DedD